MVLERLSARLLADGVPPSLLIDLFDPVGMRRALVSELAEIEAARTLAQTDLPRAGERADPQTA